MFALALLPDSPLQEGLSGGPVPPFCLVLPHSAVKARCVVQNVEGMHSETASKLDFFLSMGLEASRRVIEQPFLVFLKPSCI